MTKILKFELPTCGDCKMLDRVLNKIAESHPDVQIERHDAMQSPLAKQYEIRTVPTLIVLKDDTEAGRICHMTDESSIVKLIS